MDAAQKKTFQARLKGLRKKSGLTQEEVASELFFTRTALSNYESGRRYPSIDVLSRLARYYNVDINYLLPSEVKTSLSDDAAKRKLINFKYLIKDRYLDLSCLSDINKIELIDYYQYLKSKETGDG